MLTHLNAAWRWAAAGAAGARTMTRVQRRYACPMSPTVAEDEGPHPVLRTRQRPAADAGAAAGLVGRPG